MSLKPFKFLSNHIAIAHDGGYIFAGEVFYTMNKEEIVGISGEIIPKYIIIHRYVSRKYMNMFKPDYDKLWYFRSKNNAEYLKTLWLNQDRE